MRAALAGFMGLLLGLLVLEAGSRTYVQWGGWPIGDRYLVQPTPYFSPKLSPAAPHYWDLRMVETPQALVFSDSLELSFAYAWKTPPGTFRVVCIGDSITQIWPGAENYTHALQAELSVQLGQPVEVIPLGVGGYNPRLSLAAYSDWIRRLKPDALVLQLGPNDVDLLTLEPGAFEEFASRAQSPLAATKKHDSHSFALSGYNRKQPAQPPWSHAVWWMSFAYHNLALGDRNHDLVLVHDNSSLKAAVSAYSRLATELSVPPLAVLFPFFEDHHSGLEAERILKMLAQFRVRAIPLEPSLRAAGPLKGLSKDGIHPSSEAHLIAGRVLSRYLLDPEGG